MENQNFKENQQQFPSVETLRTAVTKATYVSEARMQFGPKAIERKVEDTSRVNDIYGRFQMGK